MKYSYYILPITLIVMGIIQHISAVKINSIFGFRTRVSSKDERTWKFCNKLCAKILTVVGTVAVIILCVITKIPNFVLNLSITGEIVNVLSISFVIFSIPIVNYRCKKTFPELFRNI